MAVSPEVASVPRRIFSPLAGGYDGPALVLSLFQYRRWHRFLLSRLTLDPAGPELLRASRPDARTGTFAPLILDFATGTGALALDLLARPRVRVVGADITRPMLERARHRAATARRPLDLVEATAEAPPFRDRAFDALVFAYLLRYVSDVPHTLRELARLVRPGGTMASLDFAVPHGPWYAPWRVYTDAVLPAAGLLFSRHWRRVGSFLGPSIRGFYACWPEQRLLDAWRAAGFPDAQSRRLSLGGALVIWGTKAG